MEIDSTADATSIRDAGGTHGTKRRVRTLTWQSLETPPLPPRKTRLCVRHRRSDAEDDILTDRPREQHRLLAHDGEGAAEVVRIDLRKLRIHRRGFEEKGGGTSHRGVCGLRADTPGEAEARLRRQQWRRRRYQRRRWCHRSRSGARAHRHSRKQYHPLGRIIEPHQECGDRALSGTAGAHERHSLPRGYVEIYSLEDPG